MSSSKAVKPLRGGRRQQVAAQVAADFVGNKSSIQELAAALGRRPCTVRRLLIEAGVVEYTTAVVGPSTAVVAERLADRYRSGEPVSRLAEHTGIDPRTIRRLVRSVGGMAPEVRPVEVTTAELARRYRQGTGLRGIAGATGLSYRAVRRRLLEAGVRLRDHAGAGHGHRARDRHRTPVTTPP
ncbi:MAG: hypothetical protein HOY78_06810 [Saccharothrix sp.]|nr:hypothetical protein [Saccharothrix sp.]